MKDDVGRRRAWSHSVHSTTTKLEWGLESEEGDGREKSRAGATGGDDCKLVET